MRFFCTLNSALCIKILYYGEENSNFRVGKRDECENIVRYFREKGTAEVGLILANRQDAFVLQRAGAPARACLLY